MKKRMGIILLAIFLLLALFCGCREGSRTEETISSVEDLAGKKLPF